MLNLIVPEFYRHLRRRYRFPRHNFYLKLFNILNIARLKITLVLITKFFSVIQKRLKLVKLYLLLKKCCPKRVQMSQRRIFETSTGTKLHVCLTVVSNLIELDNKLAVTNCGLSIIRDFLAETT